MRKLFLLTTAILFSFSSVTLAIAEPRDRGGGTAYGAFPCTGSDLNLTQEQSDNLRKMREQFLKEITPLQNRLFSKKAELRLLWAETDPDRDKILAKQKEMNEIWTQMEEKAIIHRIDSQAILTPEQRAKISELGPGSDGGFSRGWGKHGRW
jgi:Spy/CpxP family protein refolding chaperone